MEERQAKFINGYDHEEDKPGGCELEEQIHDEDEDDDRDEQEVGDSQR